MVQQGACSRYALGATGTEGLANMAVDFALLAPVPLVHLESALRVTPNQPYVSFGSMKWELFEEIDRARKGEPVGVLIYPSHDEDRAEFEYKVAWAGWYVGSTADQGEKFQEESAGRRPPSAMQYPKDNASYWAVFWRVASLTRLPPD